MKRISPDHRLHAVRKFFGGRWVDVARGWNVSKAAVSQWLADDGLPPKRALDLELLSGGDILATDVLAPKYRGSR